MISFYHWPLNFISGNTPLKYCVFLASGVTFLGYISINVCMIHHWSVANKLVCYERKISLMQCDACVIMLLMSIFWKFFFSVILYAKKMYYSAYVRSTSNFGSIGIREIGFPYMGTLWAHSRLISQKCLKSS